jgi:hypothetical protein
VKDSQLKLGVSFVVNKRRGNLSSLIKPKEVLQTFEKSLILAFRAGRLLRGGSNDLPS